MQQLIFKLSVLSWIVLGNPERNVTIFASRHPSKIFPPIPPADPRKRFPRPKGKSYRELKTNRWDVSKSDRPFRSLSGGIGNRCGAKPPICVLAVSKVFDQV